MIIINCINGNYKEVAVSILTHEDISIINDMELFTREELVDEAGIAKLIGELYYAIFAGKNNKPIGNMRISQGCKEFLIILQICFLKPF